MESRDILNVKDQLKDPTKMLVAWISDNNTKTWSERLRFIQSKKNRALHSGIKTSPYEVMFGTAQRIGVGDSALTEDMHSSIETKEELEPVAYRGGVWGFQPPPPPEIPKISVESRIA